MATPILQYVQVIPLKEKRYRIFVSYSHKDMTDAEAFFQSLRLMLRGREKLRISEAQVFFDRNNLRAGDYWDEKIQCALEEADYFVYLVSRNSLDSQYCYEKELGFAARHWSQYRSPMIIPIVLEECDWAIQPIPGDNEKRKLGSVEAIPKNDKSKLCPITSWGLHERDKAWKYVMEQLALALGETPSTMDSISSGPIHTRRTAHPLLPYFCNQSEIVNRFNIRITQWEKRALLVLTRGVCEDNLPQFCERLRTDLSYYLREKNSRLIDHKPLVWPFRSDKKPTDMKESSTIMWQALSSALTAGNRHLIKDGHILSQWLSQQEGVVSLLTALPNKKKVHLAAELKVLLGILTESPADTALDKLVITVTIEAKEVKDVLRDSDLSKALSLFGFERTHIIDLQPLEEIGWDEICDWHLTNEIETKHGVTKETLLEKVLDNKRTTLLRLGTFATEVQKLL